MEEEVKMCAEVFDKTNPQSATIVGSCVEDPGIVRYRYSKMGRTCLKYVIVDVSLDGREEYAEQEAGECRWYPFVPSAAERAAFHRLVAVGQTNDPWPLVIPIEDPDHVPERGCSGEWLMEVVEWARRGDPQAKRALMSILETQRMGIIIIRLIKRGVIWQDIGDVHHDVVVRIGERIEQLNCTPAYYKWEMRVVSDVANAHVRARRATLALTDESALAELEAGDQIEERFS
jgi:hypothetical protein